MEQTPLDPGDFPGDYGWDRVCDTDEDDDDDGLEDAVERVPMGNLGWASDPSTDHDADGCADGDLG